MRVNLSTQPLSYSSARAGAITLTLTIRPACGIPGDYECLMESTALVRMLRQQTDLPDYVIEVFERKMRIAPQATLPGVELSERVLTDIGYFID
jgi:hypothetical protein